MPEDQDTTDLQQDNGGHQDAAVVIHENVQHSDHIMLSLIPHAQQAETDTWLLLPHKQPMSATCITPLLKQLDMAAKSCGPTVAQHNMAHSAPAAQAALHILIHVAGPSADLPLVIQCLHILQAANGTVSTQGHSAILQALSQHQLADVAKNWLIHHIPRDSLSSKHVVAAALPALHTGQQRQAKTMLQFGKWQKLDDRDGSMACARLLHHGYAGDLAAIQSEVDGMLASDQQPGINVCAARVSAICKAWEKQPALAVAQLYPAVQDLVHQCHSRLGSSSCRLERSEQALQGAQMNDEHNRASLAWPFEAEVQAALHEAMHVASERGNSKHVSELLAAYHELGLPPHGDMYRLLMNLHIKQGAEPEVLEVCA